MANEQSLKLFMLLLGCRPKGRHTEQHDVFFTIGTSIKDVVPKIVAFWPEAKGVIHVDAWREVTYIDGHQISVESCGFPSTVLQETTTKLYFINLGGYRQNEFEEYHYKMLVVDADKGSAIKQARQTAFYRHTGFKGAESHIDDKYGIDVDDMYEIKDILSRDVKEKYRITISASGVNKEDELHLGYFKLDKL